MSRGREAKKAVERKSGTPEYFLNVKGTSARGEPTEEGFRVFEGSIGRTDETPSLRKRIEEGWPTPTLRRQLMEDGTLRLVGDKLVLTRDYDFSSPSRAATVIAGRVLNGWEYWLDEEGRPLSRLRESSKESPSPSSESSQGIDWFG